MASRETNDRSTINRRLLEAAACADTTSMRTLVSHDPSVLLEKNPLGNTCLHISSMYGHLGFCTELVVLNRSLLSSVNADGETPLITATTSGHATLALFLLKCYRDFKLSEEILNQDKHGCNALHHAIRFGHRELALEMIAAEPALSDIVNSINESPMFIAVMRDYEDIFQKLLDISESSRSREGPNGYTILHAAVRNGNSGIARRIIEKCPWLARAETHANITPAELAVNLDKIDVLRILLEYDWSIGYTKSTTGTPLICSAAYRGHVGVARELLKHCPDAPYETGYSSTCLHIAVKNGQAEFVEFILRSPQLRKLVNKRDKDGNSALHLAIERCDPRVVAALLSHMGIDLTMLNRLGCEATLGLLVHKEPTKISDWTEVSMLMLKADPKNATSIYYIQKLVKDTITNVSSKAFKSLTQTLISNTFLVAILIATITFAAAFTLPGGYSSSAGSEGLPVMARKAAFQAFLISDTLAMCSSLAVAFICIIARWEDIGFLLCYRSFTKKLMWFSYMATTTAFATGLYTVLAPSLLWMALAICCLPVLLPFLTKLLDEWPVLKLRFRLGRAFKSELLDMV